MATHRYRTETIADVPPADWDAAIGEAAFARYLNQTAEHWGRVVAVVPLKDGVLGIVWEDKIKTCDCC